MNMAESVLIRSQLRLILEDGTDSETGDVKKKLKSFNNVNPSSTAEQLYEVAQAFASLQTLPFHAAERTDNSELIPT